ncbi:MAG TPA: NAD(P)H-hydrate dehydratase [Pyrinomonadaceae bacterium]|nr:NAD(P)H-hydrate dehydratase [Acidobacteriota bacterium]HQZ98196.1 NAD(P)H-hydrate dehydratase [Pyrinomonadaceae bacterium]
MQKVLTAEQMREVDRLTTERYGIPSILLMENAAHAVARVITEKLGGSVKGKSVLILCGKGSNGGDGAALARILWKDGAFVPLLLFGRTNQTKGDAKVNFDILRTLEEDVATSGGEFNKLLPHEDDEDLLSLLEVALSSGGIDVVVDAMFGTGLSKELLGIYPEAIQRLEHHKPRPTIISVDLPSGLDANKSFPIGRNVAADTTVTFTAPKPANVIAPAAALNGNLIVANIGTPFELIEEQASSLFVTEPVDVERWFERTEFNEGSYKNKRGHTLIIAGSEDYSGAAVMCGNSAMRSGVGLTTLLVPASCKVEVASRVIPEVIVRTLAETDGEVSSDAFVTNPDVFRQADSILVGPGFKATDKGARKLVREIVENRTVPVVLDAGALSHGVRTLLSASPVPPARKEGEVYLNAEAASMRTGVSALPPLILTPHEGEFLRLLGTTGKEVIKDRVVAVRDYAVANNVILVLKGERVVIGSPDGRVVVNPTGNSGLGKAGNGDTLAGILAGFVAQAVKFDIDIFETVVAAVYVAGMAGDVAERKFGKRVMTASDVRECLVDVFAEFE